MTAKQKIRCILIDDEAPALDELHYLLSEFNDIEIIRTATSATQGIKLIQEEEPDLVFLDIQMPGKNGFHVLQEIMQFPNPPLVIFATAYDEYALRAFEENAVDYILKPFSQERISKSLERVRCLLFANCTEKIEVPNMNALLSGMGLGHNVLRISVEGNGRILLLEPADVILCKMEDRKIMVYTAEDIFPCYGDKTLDKLEERLQGQPFFKANRGELVNLTHVRDFAPWFNGKYVLTMNNIQENEVIISKGRVKSFRERLGLA
ncbi:LytTR family DNA-binding domain-containing protein [Maridesulfovibrio ferrireducens]|uniref:LytR/AlgR family response regulator transcription factor n=1 Tax=Maridesulfovibrio ferrireducens TaxID=246191 RepID=UPI001A2A4E39|nr:LytTR family DNA-binding domain-containing protein [Maridesulfovibrio ferrireducens]MBI9113122.1 response regulator transcription factor [Maridesulfovibrio ferrireducens]